MRRGIRLLVSTLVNIGLGTSILWGQHMARGGPAVVSGGQFGSTSPSFSFSFNPYFYPTLGWYSGYFSPYTYSSPGYNNYLPNYWWTGPYTSSDPRQDGYNPSSGYPSETVETLMLVTFPEKARVTLDGVFVGTADSLGPTQLPVGDHSLRVEAPSYEPWETILKVAQPGVRQLEVRLHPILHGAKPGPRP